MQYFHFLFTYQIPSFDDLPNTNSKLERLISFPKKWFKCNKNVPLLDYMIWIRCIYLRGFKGSSVGPVGGVISSE